MGQRRTQRCKVSRALRIQTMESRRMMAADIGCCNDSADTLVAASVGSIAVNESAQLSSVSAASTDAGSTLRTALDIGSVDGRTAIAGQVSFRDRLDIYQFDIGRDGDVELELSGLRRNADLIVADRTGSLIESSRSRGTGSESISLDLDAGTYYVAVQARSFLGTNYRLNVSAELEAEPESGSNPNTEFDLAQPLAEVDYFGGSRDWNLNAVAAPEAWAAGFTGEGITVAVVDTGVDLDHPDLVDNLFVNPGEIAGNGIDDDGNGYIDDVSGYDFAGQDANPDDVNGHGTHVAGTIAAGNNGFGATGIAHNATILPVRVLGDNGSGSTNAVAAGIRYAADLGADIINLSLGGGYSRAIDSAIDYARALGSFIVAAAGNESSSVPGFPARFSATDSNVISVGAHNRSGSIAGFSNDVGGSGSVQIDAPGVGVFSTYAGGRYASLSGTSMASPHVAGVAALALSANPNLSPSELRSLLIGGTLGQAVGSDALGQLNAGTTVAYASRGLVAPPITGTSLDNARGSSSSQVANVYRTTTVGLVSDLLVTSSVESTQEQSDDAFVSDPVSTIQIQSKRPTLVAQNDTDVSSQPRDTYFAEAGAAEASDDAYDLGEVLATELINSIV